MARRDAPAAPGHPAPVKRRRQPAAGTVALLASLYLDSPRARAWARSTARRSERIIVDFLRANPGLRVDAIRRGDMLQARDALAATPGAANDWLKAMRGLFAYAVDLEWITVSPVATIKPLPPVNPDGFEAWSEADIDRFLAYWRPGTPAHRAMMLMLYTGAARADAVQLGWQHVRGCRIEYRRQKMARRDPPLVSVPILPPLAEMLATIPAGQMTFLETQQGLPKSAAALTEDMRRWAARAGLPPGRSCHGLRKAQGRRLAEAGCSPHEIMSWLGHESIAQAAHYSRSYDRARAADSAAEKLGAAAPSNLRIMRPKPLKR